jgi:hypothetical protein
MTAGIFWVSLARVLKYLVRNVINIGTPFRESSPYASTWYRVGIRRDIRKGTTHSWTSVLDGDKLSSCTHHINLSSQGHARIQSPASHMSHIEVQVSIQNIPWGIFSEESVTEAAHVSYHFINASLSIDIGTQTTTTFVVHPIFSVRCLKRGLSSVLDPEPVWLISY